MNWPGKSGKSPSADSATEGADDKPSNALRAVHTALNLWRQVGLVTPEEFHRQEDRYDHDSGQGRELLFLIANHEWVRATSEIVHIGRSDAIETALKIDIDLRQITHEAFRGKTGLRWLPVTVLPLQSDRGRHEPDPFATVTDAADNLLPLMPADDFGHQMSAGMAEIIVNMAIAHLPRRADGVPRADPGHGRTGPPFATRDERVLLSAAVHRLLHPGSEPAAELTSAAIIKEFADFTKSLTHMPVRRGPDAARFRITEAGYRLRLMLAVYITYLGLYAEIDAAETVAETLKLAESQFAPKLAYRAVRVLQALAALTIIAVPLDIDTAPTVLTVRVPARSLSLESEQVRRMRPSTWLIRPSGHLQIDVLMPTADADRQIQVHLADGLSFGESTYPGRPDQGATAPSLDSSVRNPPPVQDLSVSMEEVLRIKKSPWPPSLSQSIADLARAKAALVSDTLRHYEVRGENDAAPASQDGLTPTDQARESLRELGRKLPSAAHNYASLVRLREFWQESGLDRLSLFRRTSVDPRGPRALVARVEQIEDVAQRATPEKAVIHADVRVSDREYFSITRTSARMSLIVMIGILASLIGWHLVSPKANPNSSVHPEVLAIVLTLFATIQAGRIERPDRTTLQGQLSSSGTGMLAASMLPPVALAVALAFQPAVLAGSLWAFACIVVQATFLGLMRWWWGPPAEGRESGDRKRDWSAFEGRRTFKTEQLDYGHFEVLRSDYWRNTTADALMLGRAAHGYVIWQGTGDHVEMDEPAPPRLEPLLVRGERKAAGKEEPENVLALLHSSTQRQAITFVAFRTKRDELLPAAEGNQGFTQSGLRVRKAVPLDLDPDRLTPADNVASTVDVFIGQHGDFPVLEKHPLIAALEAARGRLIVLEAQLPFPTPVPDYPDRQWARMRVALRDAEDIRRLTEFLHEIYARIVQPEDPAHVVAVQADSTVLPRVISEFVTPTPGGGENGPGEGAGDLYIPADSPIWDEDPGAATWRMVASCAPARSNIDSDIIDQLPFDKSRFQLAHLNYAPVHGMAAIIVLLHDTHGSAENPPVNHRVPRVQPERGGDPDTTYWNQPGMVVNGRVSRRELGQFEKCPLLHIRFRWQERPGAFLDILNSIDAVLGSDPPAIHRPRRSVSYARLYIAAGRTADGDLTIRIHPPAPWNGRGNRLMTEQLGRKISTAAAEAASAGRDPQIPGGYPDGRQNPVIRIDLLGKALSRPGGDPRHSEDGRGRAPLADPGGTEILCLFTDQANPTSNQIYAALGYQPVADMANLVIAPDAGRVARRSHPPTWPEAEQLASGPHALCRPASPAARPECQPAPDPRGSCTGTSIRTHGSAAAISSPSPPG